MSAAFSEFKEPPTAIATIASKNPKTVTTTHSREEMILRLGITEFFLFWTIELKYPIGGPNRQTAQSKALDLLLIPD
jgi:hypothetical protein